MFFAQYLNIALIVIFIYIDLNKMDLPFQFPIFQGTFKKFKPEWYNKVGTIIGMTMIFQIITPHIIFIIKPMFRYMI